MTEIETRVALLENELADLKRVVLSGGAERLLDLTEIATVIGRSPHTLRKWLKCGKTRNRYRIDEFLQKDTTGHWVTTVHKAHQWKLVLLSAPKRRAA